MNNEIKVKGMHCDACTALVRMELEENGFENKITNIELLGDEIGLITFETLDEDTFTKAKDIINDMDKYAVIEE